MAQPAPTATVLNAREEGSGPAVVLLHGLGGDHTVWNAVIPELTERFHVFALDLRGHGRTRAPEGSTYSFAEMEADLAAFLETL